MYYPVRSFFRTVVLTAAISGVSALPSDADIAPKWSDAELVTFSDVVLTGQVAAVATAWDRDTIYTYITVDVDDVLKGWVPERQIVVKQLGGRVGDLALLIGGQTKFTQGEDILAFLEVRPRDRTLTTTGLWQGKWSIRTDQNSGQRVAVRTIPGGGDDTHPLFAFVQELRQLAGNNSPPPLGTDIVVVPREVDAASAVRGVDAAEIFVPAWRREIMNGTAVPLEIQSDGQPRMPGGGIDHMLQAARHSAAGAGLSLATAGTTSGACFARFTGDGRVSVAFGDPCGEMSATGGSLAISGVWVDAAPGLHNDDESFMQIRQAGVVNGASTVALAYLTRPDCFEQIEQHELAHAFGLVHHGGSRSALAAVLDRSCTPEDQSNVATSRASGGYVGLASTTQSISPTASGSTVTLCWDPPASGGAPTTYIIEAGSMPGISDLAKLATGSTTTCFVAAGVQSGIYFVRVRAANAAGLGPPSNELAVAVSGGSVSACTPPSAPGGLSFSVSGSTVTLLWNSSAGPITSYIVEAGSSTGLSNLANFDTASAATTLTATGVGTGTYYVRVRGRNACGLSGPSNEVAVVVR
jgi:hypothetical protein